MKKKDREKFLDHFWEMSKLLTRAADLTAWASLYALQLEVGPLPDENKKILLKITEGLQAEIKKAAEFCGWVICNKDILK